MERVEQMALLVIGGAVTYGLVLLLAGLRKSHLRGPDDRSSSRA